MKTLLTIKTSLLEDYKDFANANENWTMLSYLNMKYDSNAAVAFSKLFFPNFVEHKGCVILDLFFNKSVVDDWHETLNGNIGQIEKACNSYALTNLFHINSKEAPELMHELGKALQLSWTLNAQRLFSDKGIYVMLYEESGMPSITMYTTLQ